MSSKDVAQGVISAMRSVLGRKPPYYCNEVRIPAENANALLKYIAALESNAIETTCTVCHAPADPACKFARCPQQVKT